MSQEQDYDIGVFGSDVSSAMKQVTDAMRNDLDYAWSWHCNIAMASVDEGMDHYAANKAAARFLMILAGVDTTKHPGFPQKPVEPEMAYDNKGWCQDQNLLYRVTDGPNKRNRDEIWIKMANGNRRTSECTRRAGELLDLIQAKKS